MPRAAAARSASATPGGSVPGGSATPGRTIVSASASASTPYGARTVKAPALTSSRTEQTRTRYGALPSGSRAQPKVSMGAERSNGMTPSSASTATVCMAGS